MTLTLIIVAVILFAVACLIGYLYGCLATVLFLCAWSVPSLIVITLLARAVHRAAKGDRK